jgi:hypothetical protein
MPMSLRRARPSGVAHLSEAVSGGVRVLHEAAWNLAPLVPLACPAARRRLRTQMLRLITVVAGH